MFRLICLILVAIQPADFHGYEKIAHAPMPQPNFEVKRYMGDWFTQVFLVPRSIPGFRTYTDYISRYILEPDGVVSFLISYRTPRCISNEMDYFQQDVPGVFFLRDNFGDTATGISMVVATDYDSFAIKWGCTEPIVKGYCHDPYVVAKTRKAHPAPRTMRIVDELFVRLFGLPLSDRLLTFYTHDNTCPNPFGSRCRATRHPFDFASSRNFKLSGDLLNK